MKGRHFGRSSWRGETPVPSFRKTHVGLAEALLLVAAGRVGQVGGVLALDGDVVLEGDVADLDVIEGPNSEDTNQSGERRGGEGVVKGCEKLEQRR